MQNERSKTLSRSRCREFEGNLHANEHAYFFTRGLKYYAIHSFGHVGKEFNPQNKIQFQVISLGKFAYMKIVYKYFDILVNESEMITGNATKSLVRRAYDCKIKVFLAKL